ncbi:MAG: [FeFe] hydrogenase, group A [Anaerostipes sp.]|jgi:NADP-reducing hydrogenase subunit HndD|nr:[FeFe] hydrogenase, group A [Anaerostipes sp.]MDD3745733.1 [FeFe] hydrogenase, group A [Anaerostipes sp.]
MVRLTINGKAVIVPEGTTIMEAAALNHIKIPKLCYLKDINEIAACRVCVVEQEGKEQLVTSCNNTVQEGMILYTNSPKVRRNRRKTVSMLLSQHNMQCAICSRSQNCTLQSLANELNILELPYKEEVPKETWNADFPLIRDGDKCIKCMRCVQICDKVQGLNIWDVTSTGARTSVGVSLNRDIETADCSLCGQCITHCPVGALRERDDTQEFLDAIADENKTVVVQIAPAVRTAWAESLGLTREQGTVEKIAAILRKMGVDYVFDTSFTADLTIMEEGTEFIQRFTSGDLDKYPMFTSCCPGWVRFMKTQYPKMVTRLSSAKSPQQMFGSVMKSYFAQQIQVNPENIYSVSIMPCVAKKAEKDMDFYYKEYAGHEIDCVLTTRELDRLVRSEFVDVAAVKDGYFDTPFANSTGAGVIFGATGGVMEAALRSAYVLMTGEKLEADAFKQVRGMHKYDWNEAELDIQGKTVKIAVVSGLANTRKLMEAMKRNEVKYHFVEVMACPGGCSGGGGQPIHDGKELAQERGNFLYFLDQSNQMRYSHENPDVLRLYEEFFEKPCGHLSHELLHMEQ